MLGLFFAEFIRYRYWALLCFVLQIFSFTFVAKLGPILAPLNDEVTLIIIVACFGFGLLQMILHKRKNHWAFLLQHPLSLRRIYTALASAGALNVLIAVPMAWFFNVLAFDLFTATIIDTRHYLFGFFLAAVGVTTYLIGSLMALNNSKAALLTGIGLFIIFQNLSEYIWLQTGAALLIIVYLGYLNIASFKPDLSRPLKSKLSTALLVIPMQMMIVTLLVFSTQLFYHLPKFMFSSNPSELIEAGTIEYWDALPADEKVAYLLKDTNDANNNRLGRQAMLATADTINIWTRGFSKKGQYPFRDKKYTLQDIENNNLWVFSHNEMLLQGIDNETGIVIGWLGRNGFVDALDTAGTSDRFDIVPFMMEDRFISTKEQILLVDFESKALIPKATLPKGEEQFGEPQFKQGYMALVTNKQIHLYEPTDVYSDDKSIMPSYSIPHPKRLKQIANINTYEMVDGYLLVYSGRNYNKFDHPGAEIVYITRDGKSDSLYQLDFESYNYPSIIRHFEYLVSPLLFSLDASIDHALRAFPNEKHPLSLMFSGEMPVLINIIALFLQLFSAGIILFISRLIGMNKSIQTFWWIMGAIIGIPALISFFLVNRVRESIHFNTPVGPKVPKPPAHVELVK